MQPAQTLFSLAFQGKQMFGITTFFFCIINTLYKSLYSTAAEGALCSNSWAFSIQKYCIAP